MSALLDNSGTTQRVAGSGCPLMESASDEKAPCQQQEPMQISDETQTQVTEKDKSNNKNEPQIETARPNSNNTSASSSSSTSNTTSSIGKFKDRRPEPLKLNSNFREASGSHNKDINQDTPLDLSVKSAGNIPSGSMGSFFSNLGYTNHIPQTLETPKIIWQDNEALIIKSRPFSSSTNASQKSRLCSYACDSPPITPNNIFQDIICSPTYYSSPLGSLSSCFLGADATSPLGKLLLSNHLKQQSQIKQANEDLFGSDKSPVTPRRHLTASLSHHNGEQVTGEQNVRITTSTSSVTGRGPRRSCSTENLNALTSSSVKNYRRPHKMMDEPPKSTKSTFKFQAAQVRELESVENKWPTTKETHQEPDKIDNLNDTKSNPSVDQNLKGECQRKHLDILVSGQQPSPNSRGSKPLTPTGISNATANMLNIRINSPTRQPSPFLFASQDHNSNKQMVGKLNSGGNATQVHKSPEIQVSNYRAQNQSNLDSLVLAAYNYQQNNSAEGLNTNGDTSTVCKPNQAQQQHLTPTPANAISSLGSSSATLNTPTLISSNQLRPGPLSFLHSPTLSPMSSVFELPSPLFMFQSGPLGFAHPHSRSAPASSNTVARDEMPPIDPPTEIREPQSRQVDDPSESLAKDDLTGSKSANLSHLITSAADKMSCPDENVEMSVDLDTRTVNSPDNEMATRIQTCNLNNRPATVIPRILVSNSSFQQHVGGGSSQIQGQYRYADYLAVADTNIIQASSCPGFTSPTETCQRQVRAQRDLIGKRALSPRSFKSRVTLYHRDRLESTSAPPEIYKNRGKQRIKKSAVGNNYRLETKQSIHPNWQINQTSARSSDPMMEQTQKDCVSNQNADPLLEQQVHWQQQYQRDQLYKQQAQTVCWQLNPVNAPVRLDEPHQVLQRHTSNQLYYNQNPNNGQNLTHSAHQLQAVDIPNTQVSSSTFESHPCNYPQQAQATFSSSIELDRISCAPSNYQLASLSGASSSLSSMGQANWVTNFGQWPHFEQPRAVPIQQNQFQQQEPCYQQQMFPTINQTKQVQNLHSLASSPNLSVSMEASRQENQEQLSTEIRPYSADSGSLPSNRPTSGSSDSIPTSDYRAFRSHSSVVSMGEPSGNSNPNSPATGKRYQCDQCEKAFTRSDMLTRHRRLHSGDRPFQCSECKQEFSRSDHLSTHMRTHTGEKPYTCKFCSYSACRRDMITRHMKVHSRS